MFAMPFVFEGDVSLAEGTTSSSLESGELIFWRADTGAEVKRLKAEWGGECVVVLVYDYGAGFLI